MWTLATLKTAIKDKVQDQSDELDDQLDNLIRVAEDRILQGVQSPAFQKVVSNNLSASTRLLTAPEDMISVYSFAVNNGSNVYSLLVPKDVSFMREAFPTSTTEGLPRYYARQDDNELLLGPTPDSAYAYELNYFYRPNSIVTDTDGTWISENAPMCLFYGCVYQAYLFLKGEEDLLMAYNKLFTEQLGELAQQTQRDRTDAYRSGYQ